jgi:phage terminase large subunit
VHVIEDFDGTRAREWFAALDYGFAHYTMCLLGCKDGDGNTFIVDEHAERMWLPQRHANAVLAMLTQHGLTTANLKRLVAGADVFSRQSDGTTIADQYRRCGLGLRTANMDRVNGWAEILQGFGDAGAGVRPRLFIHERCRRLVETLPILQHDPNQPEDVLKVDADEDGVGGDDGAYALRYLVATKSRELVVGRLRGL